MKKFKSHTHNRKLPATRHEDFSSLYRVQDEPPENFKTRKVSTAKPPTQTLLG